MIMQRIHQLMPLATGNGVKIALLDSGVNPALPGLKGKSFQVFNCEYTSEGVRFVTLPAHRNNDRNGHGSFVQACIYQNSPDAQVDHFRILDAQNNTNGILLCQVLDRVIAMGYNIINLSLGTRNEDYIPWLVTIIKRAYEQNIVIVAANSNVGNVLYPARFTYCVSCDAADYSDASQLGFRPNSVVEFLGRGIEVPLLDPDGQTHLVTGSSYAAGHVTGLIARVIEASHCQATVWEVKAILKEYAERCRLNLTA